MLLHRIGHIGTSILRLTFPLLDRPRTYGHHNRRHRRKHAYPLIPSTEQLRNEWFVVSNITTSIIISPRISTGDPARGALATGAIVVGESVNFCSAFADPACAGPEFKDFGSVHTEFPAGIAGEVACYRC
jgi:hypothetical protein